LPFVLRYVNHKKLRTTQQRLLNLKTKPHANARFCKDLSQFSMKPHEIEIFEEVKLPATKALTFVCMA